MNERIASLPSKLKFRDFYPVGDGPDFEVSSVTVTVDEQLRKNIQDAMQFMQEHPGIIHSTMLLNQNQYSIRPKPDGGRQPTMVFLIVDDRGRLVLSIEDDYGTAEANLNWDDVKQ